MASSSLINRAQRRIPASVIAVALAALGVIAVWVGIVGLQTAQLVTWLQWIPQQLSGLTWQAPIVYVLGIVAVLLGLFLIIAACLPGRVSGVRLQAPKATEQVTGPAVVLSRRGLARVVGSWAALVDGTDAVDVSVGGRSVRVAVRTSANDPDAVREAVAEQVRNRLAELDLQRTPTVVVQARSTN